MTEPFQWNYSRVDNRLSITCVFGGDPAVQYRAEYSWRMGGAGVYVYISVIGADCGNVFDTLFRIVPPQDHAEIDIAFDAYRRSQQESL